MDNRCAYGKAAVRDGIIADVDVVGEGG